MDGFKVIVNGIPMTVSSSENDWFIVRPIVPGMEDYSFSLLKDETVEYFIDKLNDISKNIKKISEIA